jgi:hypothetical protein
VVSSEQDVCLSESWEKVSWLAKNAFFRARLDRIELSDDLVAKIWDLKTGRRIDKDANAAQLRRYAFVITQILPEAMAIDCELYYARKRATYTSSFKVEDLAAVKDEIMRVSDSVERCRLTSTWPAKPHADLCRDCPARAGCPEKQALAGKPVTPVTRKDAERLVEKVVIQTAELEETKALLKNFVDLNGPVQSAGMVADYSVSHTLSWDTAALYRVLKEAGLDPLRLLKGDSTLIAREVRKNEALKERIEAITKDKPRTNFRLTKAGGDDDEE